jgi:photosystem II stability/assembly factor-like uncharacterized protein
VRGPGGVYRTADDGVTWAPLAGLPETIDRFAAGADPDLLYVGWTTYRVGVTVQRSRDGGATWEAIAPPAVPLPNLTAGPFCTWRLRTLAAHPTDPGRVFASAGCDTNKENGGDLARSDDQGATWATVDTWTFDAPRQLVGGLGAAPDRFYLVVAPSNGPGGRLLRSDDGGASWGPAGASPGSAAVRAVAYDPTNPDRVFVNTVGPEGIKASPDGGASWESLGVPPGGADDLAVGIDGRNVYVANRDGLHRLMP